jgi:hypothetical protein
MTLKSLFALVSQTYYLLAAHSHKGLALDRMCCTLHETGLAPQVPVTWSGEDSMHCPRLNTKGRQCLRLLRHGQKLSRSMLLRALKDLEFSKYQS